MKIKRVLGKDNNSNMINKTEYEGKLLEPVRKGEMVWLDRNGTLFHTGRVMKIKEKILRTASAVYEIVL